MLCSQLAGVQCDPTLGSDSVMLVSSSSTSVRQLAVLASPRLARGGSKGGKRPTTTNMRDSPKSMDSIGFYEQLALDSPLCKAALELRSRARTERRSPKLQKEWAGIARRITASAADLKPSEAAVLCHFLSGNLPEDHKDAKEALAAVAASHFYSKLADWTGKELAMWSSAATVHFPIVTREAYRVFLDHIAKNLAHLDANDAAVLVSALMRNKEKMHSSLRKHINSVARDLTKLLPTQLTSMTPKSIVQVSQVVPAGKVGTHQLIMQELAKRNDITAATWGQILRIYAEGNDEWIGEVWGKINEALSTADGKTTAIVLNALARAHPKNAIIRQFVLHLDERPRGWDVHSAAITCISLARLGQVQGAIDTCELNDNFAKLQDYLLTQDLRRANMLQLKQIALGFSLTYVTKVSKELWKATALAAADQQVPGTPEDRIGVLGSLSAGYLLGKATREIEVLVKSIGDNTDFRNLTSRSLNLFTMKLVKMRHFPIETMAKVESCIVENPDKFVPSGEAVLSLIHYLFACNSGSFELWKIAEAKLNALHETMRTEDLLPSVGFMATSNHRPSESVANDVLTRSVQPSPDQQETWRALVGLCKADLALHLPVHQTAMEVLAKIHKMELPTEVLRDCIDMVCQVAIYSGSSELMCDIISHFSRVKLRNTNMAWLAWSSAMLSSMELLPVTLIRSMLRVNLDYRHPVAGLCRDSRMARGVQEALGSLGRDFSAESVIGGFQIDFVST